MNKQVRITKHIAAGADADKYRINWPESTTASISKADAELQTAPAGQTLTYTGAAQALVSGGSTKDDIGTIVYSTSQNGTYSAAIPTGTGAGKYTVWYKVADSENYRGIPAASIEVEIGKAAPTISTAPTASGTEGQALSQIQLNGGATSVSGTFAWRDGSIKPGVGTSQQDAIFAPDDTANYKAVTIQIQVTMSPASTSDSSDDSSSDTGTRDVPLQTTVQGGTANTAVSAAAGSKAVEEAMADRSENIVFKQETASAVTKSQVSIPAATVGQIGSKTDADLTVSTPIADVTIPNGALDSLDRGRGTVDVAAEQTDQGLVVTVTSNGEKVEEVPGGLTLAVPAEDEIGRAHV